MMDYQAAYVSLREDVLKVLALPFGAPIRARLDEALNRATAAGVPRDPA